MQDTPEPVIATRIVRAIEALGAELRLFFRCKYVRNMTLIQTCNEMSITADRYAELNEECLRSLRNGDAS